MQAKHIIMWGPAVGVIIFIAALTSGEQNCEIHTLTRETLVREALLL